MVKDTISVAIATYNGEKYLKEQLDSLYSQTLLPDEIFVSDDCSKDGTAKILEEFRIKYGLKYVINKKSLGVNQNFEQAIRNCHGNYIIISDQDDIWFKDKIKVTYEKLKEIELEKPAMVTSQCYQIDALGNIIDKRINIKKDTYTCADTIFSPYGVTQGCSMMFNRKLLDYLKPFPSTEVCMYDAYMGFTCASVGVKYNLATPLMYYRRHDSNVFGKRNNNIGFFQHLIDQIKNFFRPVQFPNNRYHCLKYLENEYKDLFDKQTTLLYGRIMTYFNSSSKLEKIKSVWKISDLSIILRIKIIISILIVNKKYE